MNFAPDSRCRVQYLAHRRIRNQVVGILDKDEAITDYDGYQLAWSDEFNIDGKPSNEWSYETGFVRNEDCLLYTSEKSGKQTKTGAYSSEFIAFEHSDTTGAEFQAEDGIRDNER